MSCFVANQAIVKCDLEKLFQKRFQNYFPALEANHTPDAHSHHQNPLFSRVFKLSKAKEDFVMRPESNLTELLGMSRPPYLTEILTVAAFFMAPHSLWTLNTLSASTRHSNLRTIELSVQFSSVAQSCPTLCDPMNCSTPGFPVHHQPPEFTQTHVHRVGDAIQPSHPLSSPSPPAPNPSQHQSLFQWVNSSHEVAKVLEFQL